VEKLVRDLVKRLGAKEDDDIALDPLKVAMLVADEIHRRYVSQLPQFQLIDAPTKIMPGAFEWRVPEDLKAPIEKSSIADWQ
jgi:hypothetical protein